MHIPDGYLSPTTCVIGYAIMIPFWATAVKKVKAAINTKLIPLMVIGAAFSFVLMMFNVPIPDGTTAKKGMTKHSLNFYCKNVISDSLPIVYI